MTHRTTTIIAGSGFAGFLACRIGGIRVAFDTPENLGSQVLERLTANHGEVKSALTRAGERIGATETALGEVNTRLEEFDARIVDAEQKSARRGGGGGSPLEVKSWGQRFVESEEYKASTGSRDRQGPPHSCSGRGIRAGAQEHHDRYRIRRRSDPGRSARERSGDAPVGHEHGARPLRARHHGGRRGCLSADAEPHQCGGHDR